MNFNNICKGLTAIILALGFFIIIGELIIRIYLRHNIVYDIEMTRYAMNVKVDSDNPLIGHVHKPNVSARLMNTTVQINSDGLRDEEYPVESNNKYRIIVLGDSLTFGWGVEEDETFANLIEMELNKQYPVEVINFGAGNYNTEQQVNLFLEKGLKYKPDQVVVYYFINDAEITSGKSAWWFLGYSELISFYWSRINIFMNKHFATKGFNEFYSSLYKDDYIGWLNTQKAFMQLRDICKKNNIKLQVVLLPELHDVDNKIFREEYDKVSAFLDRSDIEYLSLAALFTGHRIPLDLWVSYDDAHPNKVAHKAIAETSFDFIFKRGVEKSD